MKYTLFTDEKKARKHRSTWGGWLAHDNLDQWHWFNDKYTPTGVITSPQLKGLSCKLL